MKRALFRLLAVLAVLACCFPASAARGEEGWLQWLFPLPEQVPQEDASPYGPGLNRWHFVNCLTAQELAGKYGIELPEVPGSERTPDPLYTPPEPTPLALFTIAQADSQAAIDRDGIYPVREKGMIGEVRHAFSAFPIQIVEASGGALFCTAYPDQASVLISVRQKFWFAGNYSGRSGNAAGYSCEVELTAYLLSDPEKTCRIRKSRSPGENVSVRSGSYVFWMDPPDFLGKKDFDEFVSTIMSWFGYGAQPGDRGDGVRLAKQSLIDRGYLTAGPGDLFDEAMEEAVRLLQEDYGLPQTGGIDRYTLTALYYNRKVVKKQLEEYPPVPEETGL